MLFRGFLVQVAGPQRYRLFLWHISRYANDVTYGIMLGNGVLPATVNNVNRMSDVIDFNDPSILATCLADAQLNLTLDAKASESFSLSSGGTPIWEVTVPGVSSSHAGKLVACVMEFDVVTSEQQITFQTYVTVANASRPTLTQEPATAETNSDVRGWWPRSAMEIVMNPESFDVDPMQTSPQYVHCGVCEQKSTSPPELNVTQGFGSLNLGPVITPGHQYDTDNVGAYGVNLTYKGKFKNLNDTLVGRGYVTMRRQNVLINGSPAKYWGAADPIGDITWAPGQVPKIHAEANVNNANAVDLLQFGSVNYFSVAAKAGKAGSGIPEVAFRIRVANGGAAATPVGIYRFRTNVLTQPTEESG